MLGGRDVVTLKHVQETANAAEKNKEKLPDSPAGDEEGYTSDQEEEALKMMGIKVTSRAGARGRRQKERGKGTREAWRMTILRILLDSLKEWSARVIDWQML